MEHFYSPWRKIVLYPFYYASDYLRLLYILATDKTVTIVQVNPSLIPVPLIRDAFVLLGAKLFRRRTVVFFRGWKEGVVFTLRRSRISRWLFRGVYSRADAMLVLASRFRDDLIQLGFDPSSITVTSTVFDAREVLEPSDRSGMRPSLLFLGRISQLKGIGELITSAKTLVDRGIDFECIFIGHEDREGVIQSYEAKVRELGLDSSLKFVGRLTGREKFEAYADADIFVLPSWTEGCPNSVLEALGAGLFVVSTDVGALRDIVQEGVNGVTVPPKDSGRLADALQEACVRVEELRRQKSKIQEDAAARFEARVVFAQIENLYQSVINE
jgi:glycosyltransferase involved in cell wall biosynthesis